MNVNATDHPPSMNSLLHELLLLYIYVCAVYIFFLNMLHVFLSFLFPFTFCLKILQLLVGSLCGPSFCFSRLDLQNSVCINIFQLIVLFPYIYFFVHTCGLLDVCCCFLFFFAAALAILALSCSTSGFNLVGFFGLPFCCILFGS